MPSCSPSNRLLYNFPATLSHNLPTFSTDQAVCLRSPALHHNNRCSNESHSAYHHAHQCAISGLCYASNGSLRSTAGCDRVACPLLCQHHLIGSFPAARQREINSGIKLHQPIDATHADNSDGSRSSKPSDGFTYAAPLSLISERDTPNESGLACRGDDSPSVILNRGQRSKRSDYSPPSDHSSDYMGSDDPMGEAGSQSNDGDGSGSGSEEAKEIDYEAYALQGALAEFYLTASDEQIIADLVSRGNWKPDTPIASRFTEFSAIRLNGWDHIDATKDLKKDFESHAPLQDALRDLGLSDKASPEGTNELWTYEHTLYWRKNRQYMQVSKRGLFYVYPYSSQCFQMQN